MAEFYARDALTHAPFEGRYLRHSWSVLANGVMRIKVEAVRDGAISNVNCRVMLTAT